ncbi:MAG: hypothetical protein ACRDTV_06315 [Mycobacterium sp.]
MNREHDRDDHQDQVAEEYRFDNRGGIDGPDPIAAAFETYARPPRDVVPPAPRLEHSTADLASLEGTTTTVRHYEFGADGVTEHSERVTVTRPIIKEGN